jgi:murein DD-endopeptidase MepM/ murein hydrolase activator NlpD
MRRSVTSKPDKYWRARTAPEAVDATAEARDQNRKALRRRRLSLTWPAKNEGTQSRATAARRRSMRTEAHRSRRWAPLLAFLSVGGLAVVAGIPSFAASDSSNDSSFARSAESEQSVTGTSGRQGSQRDGISAMAGFGSAGGRSLASFTNNPNGTIQWPFAVTVPISDLYGAREAPCSGCSTMHGGLDFDAGEGYPIQVIADGVVTKVQPLDDNWGDGVYVEITHNVNGQSILSRYCHLLTGSIAVSEGQEVRVAQLLAQVGATGATTGAHLHFEIHVNGSSVNPYTWLKQNAN